MTQAAGAEAAGQWLRLGPEGAAGETTCRDTGAGGAWAGASEADSEAADSERRRRVRALAGWQRAAAGGSLGAESLTLVFRLPALLAAACQWQAGPRHYNWHVQNKRDFNQRRCIFNLCATLPGLSL